MTFNASKIWANYAIVILINYLPLFCYFCILLFWMASSVMLGHWANLSIYDPKDFLMGIPAFLSLILMLLPFAVFPVILLLRRSKDKDSFSFSIYSITFILSLILYRLDLFQITAWIMD